MINTPIKQMNEHNNESFNDHFDAKRNKHKKLKNDQVSITARPGAQPLLAR
jgi:hypothetical protein